MIELKPDYILYDCLPLLINANVLDLGVGDGRNAIFLAKKGFSVLGYDQSKDEIEKLETNLLENNTSIKYELADIRKKQIEPNTYSLIIAAWVINTLSRQDSLNLIEKMKQSVVQNGLIYIGIVKKKDTLTEQELAKIFGSDFEDIINLTGKVLDLDHGEPHYHNIMQYVVRKK